MHARPVFEKNALAGGATSRQPKAALAVFAPTTKVVILMKYFIPLLVACLLLTTAAQAQVVLSAELSVPEEPFPDDIIDVLPPPNPVFGNPTGTADGLFDSQTEAWSLDVVVTDIPLTGWLGLPLYHRVLIGDANNSRVEFDAEFPEVQTGTEYRNRLTGTGDIVGGRIIFLSFQQNNGTAIGNNYLAGTIHGSVAVPEPLHYAVGLSVACLGLVLLRRLPRVLGLDFSGSRCCGGDSSDLRC